MGCSGIPFFSSDFLLQTEDDDHQPPTTTLTPLPPSCSPQDFHIGMASFPGKRSGISFPGIDHMCRDVLNGEEDLSDDVFSHGGDKKRRLTVEQVRTLEKTFEQGTKLSPERKMQLASALGLQPRQIAIWFQNRRARWKTKQLEKDYEILKSHFDAVKAENDSLISQNRKFHEQILSLRNNLDHPESINLNKETIIDQGSCSTRSDNNSDIQLDMSVTPATGSPSHAPISFPLFPTSSTHHTASANTAAKIILCPSSRPDHHQHQQLTGTNGLRAIHNTNICNNNNHHQHVKEESLNNMMLCGMEDQSGGLWPWLEQNHFN